jgi:hypothetical protein
MFLTYIGSCFQADIVLEIPTVSMRPSLDDIQQSLNKAVQFILKTTQVLILIIAPATILAKA